MDSEDRRLFEAGVRQAVAAHAGDALDTAVESALDAALDDLGWRDALADDAQVAVSVLFSAQGAANAASGALDDVLAAAAGVERKPTTAVVLPALGSGAPPGQVVGGGLAVRGTGTRALRDADAALVLADRDGAPVAVVVPRVDLTVRAAAGLDPRLGLVEVTSDGVATGAQERVGRAWPEVLALGRVALAHELVGASRAMLDLARAHALDRVQFGRPIASFQAVRHRLADSLVAIESADAAVEAAWEAGAPAPLGASYAKAIAGRSARTVARHAQQVLAGMGFTTEHPLHGYVRRTLVLDNLLGSSRALTSELGAELLRTRTLPPILPL